MDRAAASGIPMLIKFAKTLCLYRRGILADYDYPISTGPLEGTNNKIKTMKRQAYGFRDQEFFKLKILALHETRYALVGLMIFTYRAPWIKVASNIMDILGFECAYYESIGAGIRPIITALLTSLYK